MRTQPTPPTMATLRRRMRSDEQLEAVTRSRLRPGASGSRKDRRAENAGAGASCFTPVLDLLARNQITGPVVYFISLGIIYSIIPKLRPLISKFVTLSHAVNDESYVKGPDDLYLVFTGVALFTFVRAFSMRYIFFPLAGAAGIASSKARVRFAEQAWNCTYYPAFWCLGMYLMYTSPYWLNTAELWIGYPHREMRPLFKWYYLFEIAFWLQQIFVINVEQRRKDHRQMFTHHIVTTILLGLSYDNCFTRVGNAILCLMDMADIALSAAKVLKYLGFQRLCDIMFGIFILTWIYSRHYLFIKLIFSVMFDCYNLVGYKCFLGAAVDAVDAIGLENLPGDNNKKSGVIPFLAASNISSSLTEEVCFTEFKHWAFIVLLWTLQVFALIWFYMIIKVAVKVVSGGDAEDSRSDSEEGENQDEKDLQEKSLLQTQSLPLPPPPRPSSLSLSSSSSSLSSSDDDVTLVDDSSIDEKI
ncbi:TLC domain-containing protein [Lipomyces japonicus]|uniref:TLC domain-containing protein n=1 Tax=Lipomyces japonicus TaxID=56871 RepID=UPI0034CF2765